MASPFKKLTQPAREPHFDTWAGQFSCMQIGCNGWSKIARYYPSERTLEWDCAEGHTSVLEGIDE